MSAIEYRKNKRGEVTSIRLKRYAGRDDDGNELPKIVKTVKIPKGLGKREAKRFIKEEEEKFDHEADQGMTFANVRFSEYEEYFLHLKASQGLHRSTLARYKGMMERLNDAFGRKRLRDITVMDVNKFYMHLVEHDCNQKTGRELSPTTVHHYHELLSSILNMAYKEGIVAYNAAARATPPRRDKPHPEFFTEGQLHQILEAVDHAPIKWKSLIYFLALTGCRRGEALGLSWCNIDFDKGQVSVVKALSNDKEKHELGLDRTKTPSSVRVIKVPDMMLELFQELHEYQNTEREKFGDMWHETGLVWTRYRGSGGKSERKMYPGDPMHPDSLNDYLRKLSRKLGFKIHPHMFRHTLASILIPNGVPAVVISRQLGHSDPGFTEQEYTHVIQQNTAQAEETYADILLGTNSNDKKKAV